MDRDALCDAPNTHVAVFWDYENVRIPHGVRPTRAATSLRDAVRPFGQIAEMRIYYDSKKASELSTNRVSLDQSGFTLVDCPTRGTKETLDKKLIVDVMQFAHMGRKPNCVVLVTSDADYSYTLAKIRDIGVKTVVIYVPESTQRDVLVEMSDVAMSWRDDVLGLGRKGRPEAAAPARRPPPREAAAPKRPREEPAAAVDRGAVDERTLALCRCVLDGKGEWVEDALLRRGYGDAETFRWAQQSAEGCGLIETGRWNFRERVYEAVRGFNDAREHANKTFSRLTPAGRSLLDAEPREDAAGLSIEPAWSLDHLVDPESTPSPHPRGRADSHGDTRARACRYFSRNGRCNDGADCPYAHVEPAVKRRRAEASPPPKKRQDATCRYFLKNGRCNNGDSCSFSHDMTNKPRPRVPRGRPPCAAPPDSPNQPGGRGLKSGQLMTTR